MAQSDITVLEIQINSICPGVFLSNHAPGAYSASPCVNPYRNPDVLLT